MTISRPSEKSNSTQALLPDVRPYVPAIDAGFLQRAPPSGHSQSHHAAACFLPLAFFESLDRFLDQPLPGLAPFPAEKFQLLVFQLVGGDEEFLDLGTDLLGQVARVVSGPVAVRISRDRNETVIADRVLAPLG